MAARTRRDNGLAPRGFGMAGKVGAGVVALVLSSCAVPPAPANVVAAAPADPVMVAVGATAAGRTGNFSSPQYGGAASLVVRSDYVSANGQECRNYAVTGAGGAGTVALACNDGTQWRPVAPLTHGSISGFTP